MPPHKVGEIVRERDREGERERGFCSRQNVLIPKLKFESVTGILYCFLFFFFFLETSTSSPSERSQRSGGAGHSAAVRDGR